MGDSEEKKKNHTAHRAESGLGHKPDRDINLGYMQQITISDPHSGF